MQKTWIFRLTEVSKFNVKGKVLIYKKDGDIETIPLEEAMRDYQRPECLHCGDFSAEMADIACGGVGTDAATIVVLRTQKGEAVWREYEASGEVECEPIAENKRAWNILQRLARRQHNRIPTSTKVNGTAPDLPQYDQKTALDFFTDQYDINLQDAGLQEKYSAAYNGEEPPKEVMGYMAGQPIPGDPGPPVDGEKRKLPPPPTIAQGGASPLWKSE